MAPLTPSCFDCFPLPALSLPRFLPLSLPICFSFSDSLFLCLNGTSFLANRRHIHTSQQFSFPPKKAKQPEFHEALGFHMLQVFWLSIFATLLPYPSPGFCCFPRRLALSSTTSIAEEGARLKKDDFHGNRWFSFIFGGHTPLKINGWNIIMEVWFRSFSFQNGWFVGSSR